MGSLGPQDRAGVVIDPGDEVPKAQCQFCPERRQLVRVLDWHGGAFSAILDEGETALRSAGLIPAHALRAH